MPKVRIRSAGGLTPQLRTKLRTALYEQDVQVSQILDGYAGDFVVITARDEDVELLFSPACRDSLRQLQMDPVMTPEKRARQTIVVRGVDRDIIEVSNDVIKDDLHNHHSNIKVEDIYKVPNATIMKIRFETQTMANYFKKKGISIDRLRYAPNRIEEERYTPVAQCMTCYAYDHTKAQCKKKDVLWCSLCGSKNHKFNQCTNRANPKCLNCGGPHSSLSNLCSN